jgi:L-amino acid N-acyltransferase YncA
MEDGASKALHDTFGRECQELFGLAGDKFDVFLYVFVLLSAL